MHKDSDVMEALLQSSHGKPYGSKWLLSVLPTDPPMMQPENRGIKMFGIPDTLRRLVGTIAGYLGYQPR